MDAPSESNSLTALALFAASIVIDAFTAHDVLGNGGQAPTSLRTSAVILTACLAGPPIRRWMLLGQRTVVAFVLVGVALTGAHAGAQGQRQADALFVALVSASMLYTFWAGGTEKDMNGNPSLPRSNNAASFVRRESLINLALATLFYSSARVVRVGFNHPLTVGDYTHDVDAYDGTSRVMQGYAYASSVGATALCFGGAAGAATAAILFTDLELRTQGTAAATLVLTAAAAAQLTAAFVATMAQSEAMVELPAIWSVGACASPDTCPAAYKARRFTLINQCASALWVNGLGALVLAYAPSLRVRSRTEMLGAQRNFEMLVYGMLGVGIAVVSLLNYLAFTGAEALTDFACVGATVAVFVTAYVDTLAGATLFGISLIADVVTNWAADGSGDTFIQLTRCYELYLVVLLTLYASVSLFNEFFWRLLPRALVDALDMAVGVLAIAGTSAATALYLAAAATSASYDGQLYGDQLLRGPDNRFARTAAAQIAQHWLPLLVWLPLYGCRCEAVRLGWRTRAVTWYGSALLPVTVWLSALSTLDRSPTHVVGWLGTGAFLSSLVTVGVVPWSVLAWA